jgi:hypothetical protein
VVSRLGQFIRTCVDRSLAPGFIATMVGYEFLGLSGRHALMIGAALFATMAVIAVWDHRQTFGTRKNPISPERRAELHADLAVRSKRVAHQMLLGAVILLPVALVLAFVGFSQIATSLVLPMMFGTLALAAFMTYARKYLV